MELLHATMGYMFESKCQIPNVFHAPSTQSELHLYLHEYNSNHPPDSNQSIRLAAQFENSWQAQGFARPLKIWHHHQTGSSNLKLLQQNSGHDTQMEQAS